MSRGYPRFLFSDPKNVKTPGPFIVHTLYPFMVFKVVSKDDLDIIASDSSMESSMVNFNKVKLAAVKWLNQQIKSKDISL